MTPVRIVATTLHEYGRHIKPPPLPEGAGPDAEWRMWENGLHCVPGAASQNARLCVFWSITFTPSPAPSP